MPVSVKLPGRGSEWLPEQAGLRRRARDYLDIDIPRACGIEDQPYMFVNVVAVVLQSGSYGFVQ